jgi:molybdopterin synthase catalytic subunit
MAEAVAEEIVSQAESRWDVAVALLHRIGRLGVGDTAVAVVAASAHRDEAFLACRYVIEEVKRRLPIWKKEYFADGSAMWVGSDAGRGGSGQAGRLSIEERSERAPRDAGRP